MRGEAAVQDVYAVGAGALLGQPNAAWQANDLEQATIDSLTSTLTLGIITSFPGLGLATLLGLASPAACQASEPPLTVLARYRPRDSAKS